MVGLTRKELISQISQDTHVRTDVVDDVLKALVDIAVEELVNNETFTVRDLITVSAHSWGGYKLDGKEVTPHKRLKVKLPASWREIWLISQKELGGEKGVVTRANWRTILAHFRGKREGSRPQTAAGAVEETYNPLLDEED